MMFTRSFFSFESMNMRVMSKLDALLMETRSLEA
jgi:hypothetical protein